MMQGGSVFFVVCFRGWRVGVFVFILFMGGMGSLHAQSLVELEAGLARVEASSGVDDLNVLPHLKALGKWHMSQGSYDQAVVIYERMVRVTVLARGPKHPSVSQARTDLAEAYLKEGKTGQAMKTLEELVTILHDSLGDDHLQTAQARLNLAHVLLSWPDRTAESLALVDAALPVLRGKLWEDHPRVAEALWVKGRARVAGGHGEEADADFAQALAIQVSAMGSENMVVAQTLRELGWNRVGLGRWEEGMADLRRAAKIFSSDASAPLASRVETLNRLAEGYLQVRDYEKAWPVVEETLVLQEGGLGKTDLSLVKTLSDLGMIELELERFQEADQHFNRALTLALKGYGPDHLQLSFIHTNLGDLSWRRGHRDEAKSHFDRAREIAEVFFARDPLGLANWLASLGTVLHQSGNLEVSASLYAQSMGLLKENLGETHPLLQKVRMALKQIEASVPKVGALDGKREIAASQEKLDLQPAAEKPPEATLPLARENAPKDARENPQETIQNGPDEVSFVQEPLVNQEKKSRAVTEGTQPPPVVSVQKQLPAPSQETTPVNRAPIIIKKGWVIHLACFSESTPEKSARLFLNVKTLGMLVYQKNIQYEDQIFLCVFSGPYEKKEEADVAADRIRQELGIPEVEVRTFRRP